MKERQSPPQPYLHQQIKLSPLIHVPWWIYFSSNFRTLNIWKKGKTFIWIQKSYCRSVCFYPAVLNSFMWFGKESACYAEDLSYISGLGSSPGEGNGYLLQYSCLENPMDRGACQATVHGVTKSRKWLSDFHFHGKLNQDILIKMIIRCTNI